MHVPHILFAMMAIFLMVMAIPIDEKGALQEDLSSAQDGEGLIQDSEAPQTKRLNAQKCPNGWRYCGKCNGTSCKIAGINYSCDVGRCTKQSGGGDGKPCGGWGLSNPECPGRSWP